jgi:hypothetical protein
MEGGGGGTRTSLPEKNFFFLHINQTCIPTAVCIGTVNDGVILLKALLWVIQIMESLRA